MKNFYILAVILLIAAFLRFYQLGVNPPSLTWDEVAWGYNAYSLGIDGRDEFGRFLPLDYLESFGDFKPPIYAYLDVLPVKLFGLNEFATRFPSALFGTLTILMSYYLVRLLFNKSHNANLYALLTSLILAISPWHIMLSRAAFEANVATFFLITGITCFLYAIYKKPWFLILSAISFVLSMYTFNTSRIVAPLLVLLLVIVFWKVLWKIKKMAILAGVIGLVVLLPTIPFLMTPQARLRFQEVNIFSDITIIKKTNQEIVNDKNSVVAKILHNRRIAFGLAYLNHYFDNLTLDFLFIKGDRNPKFSTQTVGQMYIWEIPFLIAGVYFLFRKRENNWYLIPFWLLLAIIPAATARETPHALRIETTLPTFQILVAYGVVNSILLIKHSRKNFSHRIYRATIIVVFLFAMLNLFYFLEEYYVHYPKEFSGEWQYGYKDAINYINQVEGQYNKIYLSKSLGRPYIYMLFYKKYDPQLFRVQADVSRDPFGFVTVKSFGKYYFDRSLIGNTNSNVLYIDSPVDVPKNAHILKTFYFLNGGTVLIANSE